MKRSPMLILLATVVAFALQVAMVGGNQEPARVLPRLQRISAPVFYENALLALVDEEGVALIKFECPATKKPDVETTSEPVSYQYRYQAKGTEVVSGSGLLYERYVPNEDKSVDSLIDGGQLYVTAGHFKVEWSQGDASMGWIYYVPEKLRVQIANVKDFEELHLDRFSY
jgi:hypothetical protein